MQSIKSITAKATVQGVLAVMVMAVASTLALTDRIDGPSFLGVAIVVAGFYFRSPETSGSK